MADVDVSITDNSEAVNAEMKSRIPVILEACGLQGEKNAKKSSRVYTGRYRASITHAVSGKGGEVHTYRDDNGKEFSENIVAVPEEEQAVYIGTNVEYALHLEQLDHTIKNAIANHLNEYKNIIEEGLKKE